MLGRAARYLLCHETIGDQFQRSNSARDHLGIDYFDRRAGLIGKVTAADVKRVGAKLLDPDKLTVVIVGDPKGMDQ